MHFRWGARLRLVGHASREGIRGEKPPPSETVTAHLHALCASRWCDASHAELIQSNQVPWPGKLPRLASLACIRACESVRV